MFLLIETTTENFVLAIGNGSSLKTEKRMQSRKHSEYLVPAIADMIKGAGLTKEDIRAVGVGVGPGSFTGIRVGLSVAMTMAQVLDIPVYGISLLDLAGRKTNNPAIKAYRDKYYSAEYDDTGKRTGQYVIIDKIKVDEIGGKEAEIIPEEFLAVINRLFTAKKEGDWRKIEPIYIMNTIYKPKTRG